MISYNLFEIMMPILTFDKNKPIKLFEAFSGIGTQAMALKRLGVEINHIGISEIDEYCLLSYEAIHGKVKNYGDITKIKGSDLPEIDIFTYSFPCQDLSKIGTRKGLGKDTRSGLVWETMRVISEMKVKPKVLLMENVTDLLSKKFIGGFKEFQNILGMLGYTSWGKMLNAKDYNVAQNRNRMFMVSVLGEYAYSFPFKLERTKVLKDYLESNVDEKYYLSQKAIQMSMVDVKGDYPRRKRFKQALETTNIKGFAVTITTRAGQRPTDNFILEKANNKYNKRGVIELSGEQFNIRKLTPLETWRLMGISDEDFYKAKATGVSNAQLYKQAGNAIVVDVLYYIFKNMFIRKDE